MPRLQTSGTDCCGYVSLSGFNYISTEEACYDDVYDFKEEYLLNNPSKYAYTSSYEIDSLMEVVEEVFPKGLSMQAVLNEDQYMLKGRYWPKKLRKHGFELVRMFDNPTGSICYVYIRVPKENRLPIKGH